MERPAKRNGLVRSGDDPAVTLAIIKQNDAKMADLQESIATLMADLEREYPNIRFELTRDQTKLLSYSMDNLSSNLLVGAILAALIIFLFIILFTFCCDSYGCVNRYCLLYVINDYFMTLLSVLLKCQLFCKRYLPFTVIFSII